MLGNEIWGTLVWEKRTPVPVRPPSPTTSHWKLPEYPNLSGRLGVVYRIRFEMDEQWHSYIGLGAITARERIAKHLGKTEKFLPQRKMRLRLETGPLDVWTMSNESTLSVGNEVFYANFETKFNLLLFEAAAVAWVERMFPTENLLNRAVAQSRGTYSNSKKPAPQAVHH